MPVNALSSSSVKRLAILRGKVDLVELAPGGPWAEAVRFRHFLAHDYDDQAIPPLVWATITHDLPELDAALATVQAVTANPWTSRMFQPAL
jgi:uncharacterized protein with HEPN domain